MVNSLQVLIRYFRTVVAEDMDKVIQDVKDKAEEFNAIRRLDEMTPEDEAMAYNIANRILRSAADNIHHADTLKALTIMEDILYPDSGD